MCTTWGCGDPSGTRVGVVHQHGDGEIHAHPHPAAARPADGATRTVQIEHDILERNDALAAANRIWLADRHILALNMMSSPGAGKTTLLQRTIREIAHERPVAVIEGDQETDLDAARIRATGVPVVQINTGAGCHLDADMLRRAWRRWHRRTTAWCSWRTSETWSARRCSTWVRRPGWSSSP